MGKRGPAPKGEYAGKSQVLSTRIRPDTRDRLAEASKASGRSLSQEIEHRLRRTFIEDEKIADSFGNRQNFLIMRIAALAMQRAWNPQNPDADWLNDPRAFDQAVKTVNAVLEAIRPPGEIPAAFNELEDAAFGIAPMETAGWQWKNIQDADPSMPLQEGTVAQHRAGMMKTELGEVASRPRIFYGTAAEHRRRAEELEAEERHQRETGKPGEVASGSSTRDQSKKGQDDEG